MLSSMSGDRIFKKAAKDTVGEKGSWFQQLMQCAACRDRMGRVV